jgi:outer membrane protein assembly factor BamE (lipoprotein component of BamABCDE complex)
MGKYSITLLLITSTTFATGCSPVASPLAYMDYRQCLRVTPGMTEQQVVELMGAPQSREAKDEIWLYYREEFGSSGPIAVVLSDRNGVQRVQATACAGLG